MYQSSQGVVLQKNDEPLRGMCFLNKKPLVTGEDGAKVMEIVCAVFKSMEIGRWIELPLKEEVVSPYYKKYKK